jgi:hypothetical protein
MMPGREGPSMSLLAYRALLLVVAVELAYVWVHPLAALPFLVILALLTAMILVATVASWLPPPTENDVGL